MGSVQDMMFLVRSQKFDPVARLLADHLSRTGAHVAVVADERLGRTDTGTFEKISMTEEALGELGLTKLPADWGWFCGDMCYYMAAAQHPDCNKFCLIESDVFLPADMASGFVKAVASHPAEAIAAHLSPNHAAPKRFARGLSSFGLDPSWGCIFPVTRVTRPVLHDMQVLRCEALAQGIRLNDEAILTGAVQRGRHSHASLEEVLPGRVRSEYFATNPPHLFEAVSADTTLSSLVHPVVTFEKVIERINTGEKNYSRHRLRKVLRAAPRPMKRLLKSVLRQAETKGD